MNQITIKTKNGLAPEKIVGGNLRLPDGRRAGDLRLHELSKLLRELNIEGVTPEMGKEDCAVAYSQHLSKIRDAAGEAAVDRWREKHRPQLVKGRAE